MNIDALHSALVSIVLLTEKLRTARETLPNHDDGGQTLGEFFDQVGHDLRIATTTLTTELGLRVGGDSWPVQPTETGVGGGLNLPGASEEPSSTRIPVAISMPGRKPSVPVEASVKLGAKRTFMMRDWSPGATTLGARQRESCLDPFTRSQKNKLLELRESIHFSAGGVKSNLRTRRDGSEASALGLHQADAGSEANDRDFALSLLSQEQNALYEIDQALERIELGVYGVCERSGKAIPQARLEAIPFARFTVECQSQIERQRKTFQLRQSVTSAFGLTDLENDQDEEEGASAEEQGLEASSLYNSAGG